MKYLAIIVIGFTVLQVIVAFTNRVYRPVLEKCHEMANDLISVLIPARNEGNNIGNILNDLLNQDYKNLEVLVYDDSSEDNTAAIVEKHAKADGRIKLIRSAGLPEGWLGKNYACHCLALNAKGSLYLFIDADVRLDHDALTKVTGYYRKTNPGLITIFPVQIMNTPGEQITVPLMHYILLTLLPLILVKKTNHASLSAANGQFMLFNATVYRHFYPHQAVKEQYVEDIQIAKYLKTNSIKVDCLAVGSGIYCRMYSNLKEAVNGFSKNIFMFFGNSFILSVLFWLFTTIGFLPVFWAFRLPVFIGYLFLVVLVRIIVSVISSQSVIRNILLLIPQQLALGWIIIQAYSNRLRKQYFWKGRLIKM